MEPILVRKKLILVLCLLICSITKCSAKKTKKFFTSKILPSELVSEVEVQSFHDYQIKVFNETRNILELAEDKVEGLATKAQESYHTFHIPEHAEKINKYVNTLFESDYEENKHTEKIRYSLDHDTHFEEEDLNYNPHKLYEEGADENTTMYYYNAKCHWGIPEEDNSITDWCYIGSNFDGSDEFSTRSAVHIPLDVYKRDSVTLKDIIWTQDMDESFLRELCDDIQITTEWSYISTTNGILRYFPGRNWPSECLDDSELTYEDSLDSELMRTWKLNEDNEDDLADTKNCIDENPDVHDSRDSSWFVQSITSPKNVVIMIDNTGSVVGLTLSLIKDTVEYLMNTLTQYDFFNVVSFNNDVKFLYSNFSSCQRLIQATPRNKEMIKGLVEEVAATGHSSIHGALDEVFQIMANDTNDFPNTKIECNPTILMLSDGEGPYPQEVLERMNPEQRTRIFTYSIGKHFFSTGNLKKMACNNRGMFQAIPSNSGTHAASRKYLNVLSRAIAAAPDEVDNKWTLPYDDNLGLGRVVSVTRPVVIEEDSSEVVAVVGIDVTYERLEEHLDTKKVGLGFHTFMTENNGFLFYHPDLKNGFTHEPVAVDMLDLEYGIESQIDELRRNMINQHDEKSKELTKFTLTEEGNVKYITSADFIFSHHPLSGYVLTGGFAHPKEIDHIMDAEATRDLDSFDGLELGALLKPDKSGDVTTAIRDLECEPQEKKLTVGARILKSVCDVEKNFYEKEVREHISFSNQDEYEDFLGSKCLDARKKKRKNKKSVRYYKGEDPLEEDNLIVYGKMQNDLLDTFEELDKDNEEYLNGVHARFISSAAKPYLYRMKHFGDQTFREEIDGKVPYMEEYIERALMQTMNKVTTFSNFTLPSGENLIAAAKGIEIKSKDVFPLIHGIIMGEEEATERVFDYADNEDIFRCDDEKDCPVCGDGSADCMVLDDAGKLLMTNVEDFQDEINQLLSANCSLMNGLLEDHVYESLQLRDTQGICYPEAEPEDHNTAPTGPSSAFALKSIVGNVFRIGGWFATWVNYVSVALTSTAFIPTTYASVNDISLDSPSVLTMMNQPKPKPQHCVRKHTVHMLNTSNIPQADNDLYEVGNIPGTNLLVIALKDFDADTVRFAPQVTEKVETAHSIETEMLRYRKAIVPCQDTSTYGAEEEAITGCGAGSLEISILLVAINILALFFGTSLFSS